ncbi:hypothetical protein KMZ29_02610 [Bradyrhizobium sediminis]|uniref:Uncharacterized protein n=1 Tax=Bradyrhizobium sediminis TaxID=2840469 RepID=A0A975RNE0_9BRAD|nr:hypothetical protein [Bradyrhizobium sediminis]QWG13648.1 hypothetical protein KMZ29_02610 [Bradyrhizobium sediminis]
MSRGIIGLFITLTIVWLAFSANKDTSTATKLPPPDHANTVVAASQLNEQWEKSFDKTGKYPERQDPSFHHSMYGSLLRIPEESDSYSAARQLVDKFAVRQLKINAQERKAKIERISNDADGRKRFADTLDTGFLKAGRDASFKVSGAKNTTLEMVYILINRPFVYQITNESKFLENAWNMGFKKVIFRSGYGYGSNAWTYDVPKEWAFN